MCPNTVMTEIRHINCQEQEDYGDSTNNLNNIPFLIYLQKYSDLIINHNLIRNEIFKTFLLP